jgi:Na+-translocating ferredoxin:NAD+ oxidoreductase RnfD subunit
MPLKALREMLEETQVTEPEIAEDPEKKVQIIYSSMNSLKQTIERYKPTIAFDGFSDKARFQFKRAAYLFRKDKLHEMESN